MTSNELAERLGTRLAERGAAIVACADLRQIDPAVRMSLPRGVCIGVTLSREIGYDGTICGRCIAACPRTQRYLRESARSPGA